ELHRRPNVATAEITHLGEEQSGHIQTGRKKNCEKLRSETGKKKRKRYYDGEFEQYEIDRDKYRGIASFERMLYKKKRQKKPGRHRRGVYRQRKNESSELAGKEFPAPDRLCQQRVQRPLVHLFGNKPYAGKHGNQQADDGNRAQSEADEHD